MDKTGIINVAEPTSSINAHNKKAPEITLLLATANVGKTHRTHQCFISAFEDVATLSPKAFGLFQKTFMTSSGYNTAFYSTHYNSLTQIKQINKASTFLFCQLALHQYTDPYAGRVLLDET
jgi:hypothetical protein